MSVEPICLSSPRPADAVAVEADGCRMAAELGADIIKVMYPDDPDVLGVWCAELGVPLLSLRTGPGKRGASGRDGRAGDRRRCARDHDRRRVWQRPIDEATDLRQTLSGIVHAE